ncbi:MAG: pyridoxine 5'-phosphate synthase, partial [Bacteroidales bacterium]|nr:pyridoxine 5'-phosphate synthase [Bacteroidales bacterium]
MTRLSVNINKIATLRNARGGNVPDVVKSAIDCERFGAQGITVHPRPDERHIRYQDVLDLRPVVKTEFNIEGYPNKEFLDLVTSVKPEQVTLVPDPPGVLTSNAGWDTIKNEAFLTEVIAEFKRSGVRVSVFIETDAGMIENAAKTGADRVELYTESFAHDFPAGKEKAIKPFVDAA